MAQLPLRWLLTKASSHGLAFKRDVELDAEAKTKPIEDTFSKFLKGAYKVLSAWKRHRRPVGREPEPQTTTTILTINETIDKSVYDRWRRGEQYRPENLVDWAKRRGLDPADYSTSVTADAPIVAVVD